MSGYFKTSGYFKRRIKQPPEEIFLRCGYLGVAPTKWLLVVYTATQKMELFVKENFKRPKHSNPVKSFFPQRNLYKLVKTMLISTSRFGTGQVEGSYKTPLGLHRIAKKIGAGFPPGTVFKAREPIGYVWKGFPDATIVHRIMWLEGLEPGFNRGDNVDSFKRYIYIHGFSDETTLGRTMSFGCIHIGSDDLLPLFDVLPEGTLVFITEKCKSI
ncbi:MAG: L,D-transpeptidase [Verrucomicrobiia bacterium]